MRINKLPVVNKFNIKKTAKVILTAVLLSTPAKVAQDSFVKNLPRYDEILKCETLPQRIEKVQKSLKNFIPITVINERGGVSHTYCVEDLKKIQNILKTSRIKTSYVFPIDSALHPYIPSTGQFGSPRPAGRAHLGLDIYPQLYGRKPPKPVYITSATDGVVVSAKKSPEKDPKNLIANSIKIMSPDGKMYSYDHMARPEDYNGSKYFDIKTPGEYVKAGDTIGIIGRTGETAVWHLHMGVEDLNEMNRQLNNEQWQKLHKKYGVYAVPRGQVDPLNKLKAGEISDILNKYRIDKGPKVDYLDKL